MTFGGLVKTSNPVAGILLVIGGVAGVLQSFLVWGADDSVTNTINGLDFAKLATATAGSGLTSGKIVGYGVYVVLGGGVIALLIGLSMFGRSRHRGPGVVALVVGILMTVPAVVFLVEGGFPSTAEIGLYLFLGAGIVTVLGGLVGAAKK